MATYITEEKEPGTCGFCRKQFQFLSSFIRHVTHSKLCLEYHDRDDPEFIEKLKRRSRLETKKRYFQNAWKSGLKEERQKKRDNLKTADGKSSQAKKYYISVGERGSFKGKLVCLIFYEFP